MIFPSTEPEFSRENQPPRLGHYICDLYIINIEKMYVLLDFIKITTSHVVNSCMSVSFCLLTHLNCMHVVGFRASLPLIDISILGCLVFQWPCGVIVSVDEMFNCESKSQVYGHLHRLLKEKQLSTVGTFLKQFLKQAFNWIELLRPYKSQLVILKLCEPLFVSVYTANSIKVSKCKNMQNLLKLIIFPTLAALFRGT